MYFTNGGGTPTLDVEKASAVTDRFSSVYCCLVLAVYEVALFCCTSYIAGKRKLWWDEIITQSIATLPNWDTIWRALVLGADAQPPLFYFIMHFVVRFGTNEFILRIPSLVAYSLTTFLIFFAVRRRTTPWHGLCAALLLSITESLPYAFEARPYALMLLFTVVAFVAWQSVRDKSVRPYAIAGLSLALSADICVHYNAVLVLLPFLIGEICYTFQRRMIDLWSITAIGLAPWPLLMFRSQLTAVRAYTSDYWGSSTFAAMQEMYFALFAQPFLLVILSISILCVLCSTRRIERKLRFDLGPLPAHELATSAAFLLLPAFSVAVSLYTKAIHFRYVLETCVGAAIAASFILFALHLKRSATFAVAIIIGLELLHTLSGQVRWPQNDGWGTPAAYSDLLAASPTSLGDIPFVLGVGPYHIVIRYGSKELKSRCYYAITSSHQRGHVAIIEQALRTVNADFAHVVAFEDFKRHHPTFRVYAPDPWFLADLISEGDRVRAPFELGKEIVYEVNVTAAPRNARP